MMKRPVAHVGCMYTVEGSLDNMFVWSEMEKDFQQHTGGADLPVDLQGDWVRFLNALIS